MATEQTLTQTPIKSPMEDASATTPKGDEDAAAKSQQVVTESNGNADESKTKSSNIFEGRKFDWWSDTKGSMYGLLRMNEIRLPMVKETLLGDKKPENDDKPLSGFTIMDVGCGGGLLCEPMASLGAQVTGIDISKESVEVAEEHMSKFSPDLEKNLKYINISVEDFIKQQNYQQFDAVIASEVAEHVTNLEEFTIGCLKLVKPGGHFLVTTINKTFAAYLRYILIDEKILHRLPQGTHPYNMLVPPAKLKAIVEKNGFVVKCVKGFMCNPVTRKWSWAKTTSVNYFLVAQKKEKEEDQDQNETEKIKTEEENEKKNDQEK